MKPSERIKEIEYELQVCGMQKIDAKSQAIIDYLDEIIPQKANRSARDIRLD